MTSNTRLDYVCDHVMVDTRVNFEEQVQLACQIAPLQCYPYLSVCTFNNHLIIL